MTRTDPKYLLPIVVAIGACAGAAAGSWLAPRPIGELPPMTQEFSGSLADQISILAESSRVMTQSAVRVESKLDELLARLDSSATDPTDAQRAAVQVVECESPPSDLPCPHPCQVGNSDWVSVMDRHIARVLVERGLTPFDPGVSESTREACSDLREADDEFQTILSPVKKLNRNGKLHWSEYDKVLRELLQERRNERRIIINELSAALDALGL